MVSGSNGEGENDAALNDIGLVGLHAYAVLDVREIEKDGKQHQLIKLRNPWGQTEFDGEWGDSSKNWIPAIAKKLQFTKANDGTFWMTLEEFRQYFGMS